MNHVSSDFRQRTPSRFRQSESGGNSSRGGKSDREWNDLLKRRKKYKENWNRIKDELDDATRTLESMGRSRHLNSDTDMNKILAQYKFSATEKSSPNLLRKSPDISARFSSKIELSPNLPRKSPDFSSRSHVSLQLSPTFPQKAATNLPSRFAALGNNESVIEPAAKMTLSTVAPVSAKILSGTPSRWAGTTTATRESASAAQTRSNVMLPPHPPIVPVPPSPAFQSSLTAKSWTTSQFNQVSQSEDVDRHRQQQQQQQQRQQQQQQVENILKPKKLKLVHHGYDRCPIFCEEFVILFRSRHTEELSKAKILLSSFNLSLAIVKTNQAFHGLDVKDQPAIQGAIHVQPIKETCRFSVPTTNVTNSWHFAERLCNLPSGLDIVNAALHEGDLNKSNHYQPSVKVGKPKEEPSEYLLHMGRLSSKDLEEFHKLDEENKNNKYNRLNSSDEHLDNKSNDNIKSSHNKVENVLKQENHRYSSSLIAAGDLDSSNSNCNSNCNNHQSNDKTTSNNSSNNLSRMWYSLYKTDLSESDSESEYEYEDEDPASPYYTDPTLNIEPDQETLKILTDWTAKVISHDRQVLEELNQSWLACDENLSILEERIFHPKTREILGLAEVTTQTLRQGERLRHGFYREFDADCRHVLLLGRCVGDEKVGVAWRNTEGNGFLVSPIDNNNNVVEGVFLYPDLTCAISGTFKNGRLVAGKFGKVTKVTFDEAGIPYPQVESLVEDQTFTYDPSMSVCISRSPTVRDPFEHQNVYVAQSRIAFAGEGLYAKRFLPAGSLIALFNGIRQREIGGAIKKMAEFSDYRIGIGNSEVCLDIPNQYVTLNKYSATTGHKACHSFTPNAGFKEFAHPRFGRIMSIVAEVDIERHTEVLVSYNYRIHQAPAWYQDLYFQHLRDDQNLPEENICMMARRIGRQHGVTLIVPPPPPSSSRFLACGSCGSHVSYDDVSLDCVTCEKWFHIRCTTLSTSDVLDEDESGNRVAKDHSNWQCAPCKSSTPHGVQSLIIG